MNDKDGAKLASVSQILVKTGLDENSTYFDLGVDYFEGDFTEEGFYTKMYAFHVHKLAHTITM